MKYKQGNDGGLKVIAHLQKKYCGPPKVTFLFIEWSKLPFFSESRIKNLKGFVKEESICRMQKVYRY